jgi:hypothetical protein
MNTVYGASPRRRTAIEPPWPRPSDAAPQNAVRRAQAQGPEGAVHFFLQRIKGGLYVEREEIPSHGIRTCQALLFSARADFERWCNDDPARFTHPLLHARVKRDGEALWRVRC